MKPEKHGRSLLSQTDSPLGGAVCGIVQLRGSGAVI